MSIEAQLAEGGHRDVFGGYPVAEHPIGRGIYVLFSGDGGSSWDPPVSVVDPADSIFSEPDIAEVAPGELYCILRSELPRPEL